MYAFIVAEAEHNCWEEAAEGNLWATGARS